VTAAEGPPEPDHMISEIWRLVYQRKPARALVLVLALRAWFAQRDDDTSGLDTTAGHYRTFLHGVQLALEATADAKRMKRDLARLTK